MSQQSKIEWTEATWNPTRGCSMAAGSNSPECGGCYNCYAARQALRMSGPGGAYEGLVKLTEHGPRWTGKIAVGDLEAPLRWRKPQRVFVDSMSDLFHESRTNGQIYRNFAVMALADWHTYQILTKRAERMERCLSDVYFQDGVTGALWDLCKAKGLKLPSPPLFPLRHVWLGISAETQPTLDARVVHLLRTPAAVRFVSLEPLLGPIHHIPPGLDWVIVGGESGPGARPFDLEWARDVIEQCKAAGVPCFMKQMGAKPIMHPPFLKPMEVIQTDTSQPVADDADIPVVLKDKKGGDPEEWPKWARVRQMPGSQESGESFSRSTGKLVQKQSG